MFSAIFQRTRNFFLSEKNYVEEKKVVEYLLRRGGRVQRQFGIVVKSQV